jgi:hypothetical protein
MYEYNVRRLICITGAMIGDFTPNQSKFIKLWQTGLIKANRSLRWTGSNRRLLKASELDWTLIKPPRLSNGSLSNYKIGEQLNITAFSSISRKTIASLIIDILDDKSTFRKAMFVTK